MTDRAREPRERSVLSTWGYLIFLGFILLSPTFETDPASYRWPLEIAVVVVAGAAFIWGSIRGQTEKWVSAAFLVAIAIAVTPTGSSAISVLPIYAAALIATFGTRRQVYIRLAVISVLTLAVLPTSPVPWPFVLFLAFPAVFVWIVGAAVYEDVALESHADALRAENARIEYLATVTERERISRDLHDLAGQALTGLILRSQLVQRLAPEDPARAIEEARAMESEARGLLAQFRGTVSGWQQATLIDELDGARRALGAAEVGLIEDVETVALAPSVETVLALALRESVTNVVRHSQARTCRIGFGQGDGVVTLSVVDDGVGAHDGAGSGLRGMRERVIAAGGQLSITDDGGTSVHVEIPIGGPA